MDSEGSLIIKKKSFPEKLAFQIKLLIWKRWKESTKTKWDLLKVTLPAMLFFVLMILIYEVFDFFYDDGIEPFFVPLAFWIFVQRLVVQVMHEKSNKLHESMRMMGLSDVAYYLSYFISDGVILGFFLSFLCTIFTVGGLFNSANFGVILGLLFVFCLSAVPFAFFLCSFFDSPQTSGQATIGILLGLYVLYIVIFTANAGELDLKVEQRICCLFPPLALQIGSGAFLNSYDGIPVSEICGIMVADIPLYIVLAWYFQQVWPSDVGVAKPFYFVLLPSYWFPTWGRTNSSLRSASAEGDHNNNLELSVSDRGSNGAAADAIENPMSVVDAAKVPREKVNEALVGPPTVTITRLNKTFGEQRAVNNLSFKMYENQIFALLGHNGAGKTTTISMLTGLIPVDASRDATDGATIYGHSVLTEMEQIRYSMGVCPQHDVLFENLTVLEHILFFAQLKGKSYEEAVTEADSLTHLFHLGERQHNTGSELSGGQRRKLSVSIAICGGSKFVVLDEPTAGMDPLARRELWDLLASLRKGRTMLLTTHYMDEADILGDRVGIMSLGQMQCVGSTQFLKSTYGAGYKLIFDKKEGGMNADQLAKLTAFVQQHVPSAKYFEEDGAENQVLYSLPFDTVSGFGPFFTALEPELANLSVATFGVSITSLEDVFLKVGEDHSVKPKEGDEIMVGIGADRTYESNMRSQIIGVAKRRLTYAINDFVTVPLLGLPISVAIVGAALVKTKIMTDNEFTNYMILCAMYMGAYLGAPGLIAEFVVKERNDKLRNVLTVMGCDFKAYWIGTFIADYMLMSIPMVCIWITWFAAGLGEFYKGDKGWLSFLVFIFFNADLVAFSYFFSYVFDSPKACISMMPIVIIMLLITPNICLLIVIQLADAFGTGIKQSIQGGILMWGTMLLSPGGALFCGIVDSALDLSKYVSQFPNVGATIAFMVAWTVLFMAYAYFTDVQSIAVAEAQVDPKFDEQAMVAGLDSDVLEERARTLSSQEVVPLRIEHLRKVFPAKRAGQRAVVATQDVSFMVEKGETFGLLGANGAGKTTTLSMLTRHLLPTAGDAFVDSHSILSNFSKAATHIGVVTQNNSLWDRLTVEAHLKLFARLRGVPEDLVYKVVDGTIDQLELTPHRKKYAMNLSGGMKRKLCVAIALIGDPSVVLLDEPSAGLDPVSRRNLWTVILRTMSHRAVILTTHSMDEAEALCKRIGIMVHGQLRALGTKQHLKNKFGSGFELVVKLIMSDHVSQVVEFTNFVNSLFPTAKILSENGGLLTYQIPKEEMNMGRAFTAMEGNKKKYNIEDYSIAQPTLEQVFIRTVNRYSSSDQSKEAAAGAGMATSVEGGGVRLSAANLIEGDATHDAFGRELGEIQEEVEVEKNKLGCTNFCVKIMSGVSAGLFIVFIAVSIALHKSDPSASAGIWVLAIISLIVSITGCNILCCSCCQQPKGADE